MEKEQLDSDYDYKILDANNENDYERFENEDLPEEHYFSIGNWKYKSSYDNDIKIILEKLNNIDLSQYKDWTVKFVILVGIYYEDVDAAPVIQAERMETDEEVEKRLIQEEIIYKARKEKEALEKEKRKKEKELAKLKELEDKYRKEK